ncbi:xylose isomerase [Paenibacillus sp. FSL H8-0548]|uniref:sugar phosphate isomerase/epimerase family protein n=1 Tax=Paenibacillus sp. FSL H8-0548 TaxID=1920422 RepID=UPI00096BE586|nr:xylose isomerase [Paenibacillus sp. FSL H8-0548]OMF26766.1 xylose isomerase [Paenibacillus sp. FSL H8-0548]
MGIRNAVNDGSSNAPRLELQQSWWAMNSLGENGKEWTMEQKFEKIAEAGYAAISASIPSLEEAKEWHRLLDRYKLGFNAMAFPSKVEDINAILEEAKRFGRVQYVNLQVMDSFVIDQQAIHLLSGLLAKAKEAGMPTFIETHRGTVTQDIIRTAAYARELPELRFMIDLSHYVVSGELNGSLLHAEEYFGKLLERTSGIHARVSNGEQVQIDVGTEGDHPMLHNFERWWRKGMASWLQQAQPGDVLPFVTELGPPGYYAITQRVAGGVEREISDRWQQALLFKRIALAQWQRVLSEAE